MNPADIALQPYATPAAIEARSFAIIDAEVPEPRPFVGPAWEIVRRMIHTSADFELLRLARLHPDAVAAGVAALSRGASIYTDTEMARAGIPTRRLDPFGARVACLLADPAVADLAAQKGSTRAAAAVELARTKLAGAIVVIGNAPTALLALLDILAQPGVEPPALLIAMPVGFVNAAESKELLMAQAPAPYVTIQGRKGGSALAASVVNALAEIALREHRA